MPVVLLVALLSAPPPATAGLDVIGGSGKRTLVLRPCRETSTPVRSDAQALSSGRCRNKPTVVPALVGLLSLALSNTTHKAERVQLLYSRQDGATTRLPGASSFVSLSGKRSRHSPRTWVIIRARATRVLLLHFVLPARHASTALDGTLTLRPLGHSTQVVNVPVTTSVPVPPGVRLEPSELTLSNDRWSPGASATITLVGPGVGIFAAAVGSRHTFALYDANNHAAKLSLETFKSSQAEPGLAEAKLSLDGKPAAGAYDGELTLFPLTPAAPRLKLKVNSHCSFWLAVILVFVGVGIGSGALFLYALDVRRRVLLDALNEAYKRLKKVHGKLGKESANVASATWYLDDLAIAHCLEDRDTPNLPTGRLPGVERLRKRIAGARNDRDLDEDTDTVLEVIARIQRWLRLAPAAWCLCKASHELPPEASVWRETSTWRDTCLLLRRLHYEPGTAEEVDDLVARALWQVHWHRRFAALFKCTRGRYIERDSLLKLEGRAKQGVFTRTATERDELACDLALLAKQIDCPLPAGLSKSDLPSGLEVNWETTPNLFTGWATLDGTSWRGIQGHAVHRTGSRTPARLRDTFSRWVHIRSLADLIWLVLPTVAASAFYAVTLYNDTWGSPTDLVTALTAGFVGKVVIDWASLPAFQSHRLRPAAKQPADSQPAPGNT